MASTITMTANFANTNHTTSLRTKEEARANAWSARMINKAGDASKWLAMQTAKGAAVVETETTPLVLNGTAKTLGVAASVLNYMQKKADAGSKAAQELHDRLAPIDPQKMAAAQTARPVAPGQVRVTVEGMEVEMGMAEFIEFQKAMARK